MNDDLKPTNGTLTGSVDAQKAFHLAELIALRLRDSSVSEASRLAADVIACEIRDVALSWTIFQAISVEQA